MATIAQQIKKELKAAFPGVKFSCKMYHSTCYVEYIDGPTTSEVKEITEKYSDYRVDLYTDCTYGTYSVNVVREFSEQLNNDVLDAMEAKGFTRECPRDWNGRHHWNEAYNYFLSGKTSRIDPEQRMAILAEREAEAAKKAEEEALGYTTVEAERVISPIEVPTTPFFTTAKFASLNKNCTIGEYEAECDKPEFYNEAKGYRNWAINEVKVTKVFALSPEDYDWFVDGGLMGVESDKQWIEGLGGTDSHNDHYYNVEHFHQLTEDQQKHWLEGAYNLVVAVYAPGRDVIFVDPQGYGYARYVGLSLNQQESKNLLLHHADKTEQPQVAQAPLELPEVVEIPTLQVIPDNWNPRNNPTLYHNGELCYIVKFAQVKNGVPTTWFVQGLSGERYEVPSAMIQATIAA